MASGVSKFRLNAVEFCKTHGWTVGMLLVSPSYWECEREIKDIGTRFVTLRIVKRGTGHRERVVTFPIDVRLAGGAT